MTSKLSFNCSDSALSFPFLRQQHASIGSSSFGPRLPGLRARPATRSSRVTKRPLPSGRPISGLVKAEMFPPEVRAMRVGLAYAVANAIFGGSPEYVALRFRDSGAETNFYWCVTLM